MQVQYCPECDTEFRPEIQRCSDCGGPLEPRLEGEESPDPPLPPTPPLATVGGMSEPLAQDVLAEHFFRSSDFGPTDQVAALLSAAGIPYRVALSGLELILWIRTADRKAAEAAVGDGFVLCPPTGNQELPEGEAVACPGCGQTLREGATECPGCGLPFEAGPLPRCARCGQVLPVEEGPCPDCDG